MKRLLAVLLCIAPLPALADEPLVGLAECEAERAVYELTEPDSDDVWRIGFVSTPDWASIVSDLFLRLTTPQRDYWFTFSVSMGYSGISILPVTDPTHRGGGNSLLDSRSDDSSDDTTRDYILDTLRFISFDADLVADYAPPVAGEAAPSYIILPELGVTLWYSAASLTDDPDAMRDPMPRGVFRLTECLEAPHPPVTPYRDE